MKTIQALFISVSALHLFSLDALAHARLVKSSPAIGSVLTADTVPPQVSLEFSEDLELRMSKVRVRTGAQGGLDFTQGAVSALDGKKNVLEIKLKRPLLAGVYFVKWNVMAVNTHKTSGEYRFTVTPEVK